MASLVDNIAVTVDRADEIIKHFGVMESLLIMRVLTLPFQCTLAPILSLPVILMNVFRTDKVHVIPTPFTEAIVYEITEIIKYARFDYRP